MGSAQQPHIWLETPSQLQLYEATHCRGEEPNLNVLVVAVRLLSVSMIEATDEGQGIWRYFGHTGKHDGLAEGDLGGGIFSRLPVLVGMIWEVYCIPGRLLQGPVKFCHLCAM